MSMGTVAEDHTGFQIFVGDRAEFPVMRERSLLVRWLHLRYTNKEKNTKTKTNTMTMTQTRQSRESAAFLSRGSTCNSNNPLQAWPGDLP